MKGLHHYQALAQGMIEADGPRDEMLRAMDAMWHNRWRLPENVAGLQWIHKVVSSDPHDAIRAGTRVLSIVAPQVKLQPMGRGGANRARADKIERALSWHFRNASRRRRASVLRDVVLSALLYDEVVAQVVFLPEQVEALKAFKGETGRLEAAKRYGPFAVIVRNPQQVHVRYSDWMPEAVLLKKLMTVQEAADFWGAKGRKVLEAAQAPKGKGRSQPEMGYCTVYDYMDAEERVVWAIPQQDGGALMAPTGEAAGADGVEILREAHGLGFLPWAAKVGGTTLEEGAGHQRVPLLYSLYTSGAWETQNIVETLLTSEVIAYAAAPRLKVEGPTDGVEVDYGEPGRPAYVPPGHGLSTMQLPGMDQGLAIVAQRVAERIGKSTVPRILQTGDFPSGTAFATLNLATQSGIKALNPYKELAEDALAEVFTLMLQWVRHSGEPLVAGSVRKGEAGDEGRPLMVKPSEIALDEYFVEVELTADVPTDRMARINAASLAVRELGYSRQRALEQIGEADPQDVMAEAEQEELAALELDLLKQRKQALAQVEVEKLVEHLRSAGTEEEETPEAEAPTPAEAQPRTEQKGLGWLTERVRGLIRGQGFDTGRGGTPPAMADPEGQAAKQVEGQGGRK